MLQILKRVGHWTVDYAYMFRGMGLMYYHHNPPKHYLEYTLPGKCPVILIPGILEKWGFMKQFGDRISLQRHPVYVIPELGMNLTDIPFAARKIKQLIREVLPHFGHNVPNLDLRAKQVRKFLEKYNITGAVIVAHSKGGLIGKYILAHYNQDHKILGMIAIATPFNGSPLAKMIMHPAFKDLTPASKILEDLEAHTSVNKEIISIIPEFDNHVWGKRGSFLEGGTNIYVDVKGHHKILFSRKVQNLVLESIEKISRNQ